MQRVALVHDWLVTWAGAEKALEQLLKMFPQADLYTLVDFLPSAQRAPLQGRLITTSFIQRLPWARKQYRSYLPLMPLAVEQFDLSEYDLVISSSHAVAKGVITGPDTRHLCYCYTPMRYAWDLQHDYLRETRPGRLKSAIQRYLLHRLRVWDLAASQRPDAYIAISQYIARRIAKHYRRPAEVIYPPVKSSHLAAYPEQKKAGYYLAASRLVPYKRLLLIVEAFASLPDKQLVIIGDGPERPRLEKRLKQLRQQGQHNIRYLGYQPDAVLHQSLAEAQAFIFAAEEDFGILPVEAQALGTPVIAYGKGGARETLQEGVTGLFFDRATPEAIQQALHDFESRTWSPQACRDQAQQFSEQAFQAHWAALLQRSPTD